MAELKLSKNDIAWKSLFDELHINEHIEDEGFFRITAKQIKQYGKREPRLMTKFDHKSTRPILFKKNKLSILPDTRGSYIIGKFDAYSDIKFESQHPIRIEFPHYLESLDIENITSESIALNVAHVSGMIDEVLESQDIKCALTLNGRMSSNRFDYFVGKNRFNITVENSQIEIDGSYENLEKIAIIEAKNRLPEDFLIRQLYYPYRLLQSKNLTKEIVPIFFTYVDDIFSFHIYEFSELLNYSSIQKTHQLDFILDESIDITYDEIIYINNKYEDYELMETVTFPQADTFSRVLDMLDLIVEPKTRIEIAEHYKFDIRQSDYYYNALNYLGFAARSDKGFILTEVGKKIQSMRNSKSRNLEIIDRILRHRPFNLLFGYYVRTGGDVDKSYVESLLMKYGIDSRGNTLSPGLADRRSQTAIGWVEWILGNISD